MAVAGQGTAWHSSARQGWVGLGRSGQGRQRRAGQVRSGQVSSGQVRSGQVRSGQVRSGQRRSGQRRSEQGRAALAGRVREAHRAAHRVRDCRAAEQIMAGQVRAA